MLYTVVPLTAALGMMILTRQMDKEEAVDDFTDFWKHTLWFVLCNLYLKSLIDFVGKQ